jgi:hypothetical protein
MESGSLTIPEPSGPHRAVMEMLYLYLLLYLIVNADIFCVKIETDI